LPAVLHLDGPIVVAAGLQDPGNLGTIVRTAEATGAAGVVLTPGTVDPFSPKVVRASAGSVLRVPLVEAPVDEILAATGQLDRRGVATVMAAEQSLWDAELDDRSVVWIGNEGAGLDDGILGRLDNRVCIPMAAGIESLNAGISAAVLLYELARRRGLPGV
jgi:TrmH family RNA methyltransferase